MTFTFPFQVFLRPLVVPPRHARRDFLAGAALPAMFRAVPPAAVLCRIFALAQASRGLHLSERDVIWEGTTHKSRHEVVLVAMKMQASPFNQSVASNLPLERFTDSTWSCRATRARRQGWCRVLPGACLITCR